MKKLFIIILWCATYTVNAQTVSSHTENFLKRLSVRQSFQGKLEKEEAAFINLVLPKDGEESFNYSFAVGYNVLNPDLSLAKLRPFVEAQKNTLLKSKQDVVLSGLDFQTYFWDVIEKERTWTPYLITKVNYKKDNVKNTEGTQGSLFISPIFNGKGGKFSLLPDAVSQYKDSVIRFYYNAYAGIEYESRNSSDVTTNGDVWRFTYRLTANVTLWQKIEIIPDYINRSLFVRKTVAEKDKSEWFKLTLNWILATKEKTKIADVKIGLDFVKGVDPAKGFDNQQATTLTLKFKI